MTTQAEETLSESQAAESAFAEAIGVATFESETVQVGNQIFLKFKVGREARSMSGPSGKYNGNYPLAIPLKDFSA